MKIGYTIFYNQLVEQTRDQIRTTVSISKIILLRYTWNTSKKVFATSYQTTVYNINKLDGYTNLDKLSSEERDFL